MVESTCNGKCVYCQDIDSGNLYLIKKWKHRMQKQTITRLGAG